MSLLRCRDTKSGRPLTKVTLMVSLRSAGKGHRSHPTSTRLGWARFVTVRCVARRTGQWLETRKTRGKETIRA